jgi:hypothetical protein
VNVSIPIGAHLVPPDKVESLNRHVLRRAHLLQTHVVSQHLGITRERTIAMLGLIAVRVSGQLVFLIYHNSCPEMADAFVEERPAHQGLPSFPYVCPACERTITNEHALSYDIALRIPPETEVRIESPHG